MKSLLIWGLMVVPWLCQWANAAERHYSLTIDYQLINITGEPVQAMAVNGQFPGPTLTFQEGDDAVITVTNKMDVESSIHWHGLLVPPEQDGVPYLSYFPIKPGESFTYRFPIKHAGTYWYHSHTNIQEQRGLHGAIVIQPVQKEPYRYDHEAVLLLQDWTNENPKKILGNLKKDGDWYAHKKDSVISLSGYLNHGTLKNWWQSRWTRMGGMDVSDVGYDAFLINGQKKQRLLEQAKPGEKIRLRVINVGASSYFWLQISDGQMKVVQADGLDVQPVTVDEILMASAETYDLIVTVPEAGALELRATSQDVTGSASVILGKGEVSHMGVREKPNPYIVDHSQHVQAGKRSVSNQHSHHGSHSSGKLDYAMLKSKEPVAFDGFDREVVLQLTGDMENYNWSFNQTPLSKADVIKVKKGEVVRFTFVNQTMMHHPLHLHGHFFKVISGHGDHDVMKHTVDVAPLQTVTIEFLANEEKDWFFHCHNLYHAKTGMGRIIRYEGYEPAPALMKAKMQSSEIKDTDWYYNGAIQLLDDYAALEARYGNASHALELDYDRHAWAEEEVEFSYLYRLNRWSEWFLSAQKESDEDSKVRLGLRYMLPLLIESETWLDSDSDINIKLETDIQLSKHIKMMMELESDNDWFLGLEYRVSPHWAIQWQYRDEVDAVFGFEINF